MPVIQGNLQPQALPCAGGACSKEGSGIAAPSFLESKPWALYSGRREPDGNTLCPAQEESRNNQQEKVSTGVSLKACLPEQSLTPMGMQKAEVTIRDSQNNLGWKGS